MCLSTTEARVQYAPTGATVFAFPYLFLANTHLVVILTTVGEVDIPQVLGVDYTVTGALNPSGGSITMASAPATGTKLTIYRQVPLTQLVDYVANDSFPAETHETALDKLTMLCQQLYDFVNRCLSLPVTEPVTTSTAIPNAATRANKVLGFDVSGNITPFDITAIPVALGSVVFNLTAPAGSDIAKTVTVNLVGSSAPQLIRAWLVDSTVSVPTLIRTLDVPDALNDVNFEAISSAGVASFTIIHNIGVKSWKLCVEVSGVVKLSDAIVLGV